MNIQRQEIEPQKLISYFDSKEYENLKEIEKLRIKNLKRDIESIADLLKVSKKPMLLL